MSKSITAALAFLALAGAASAEQPRSARFERADADKSGDVTYEEFAAAIGKRVKAADADGDGRITVAEVADEIGQKRAGLLLRRFDADKDGAVTTAEIETRQKAAFARLDANKDGKIVPEEMPGRASRGQAASTDATP